MTVPEPTITPLIGENSPLYASDSNENDEELGGTREALVQNDGRCEQDLQLPYEIRSSRFTLIVLPCAAIYIMMLAIYGFLTNNDTLKDKIFVFVIALAGCAVLVLPSRRFLIRIDQQGVTHRVLRTQFIPWEEMRCIRVKRELDPNAEFICPDGRCFRPTVRTVVLFIGSRDIISINYHAEKLEMMLRIICAYRPDLVDIVPGARMRRSGMW